MLLALQVACGATSEGSRARDVLQPADAPAAPEARPEANLAPSEGAAPAPSAAPSTPPAAEVPTPTPEPAPTPEPGSLRVAFVHAGALLKSEATAIERIDRALQSRRRGALSIGEASADEMPAARALFAGAEAPAIPGSWRRVETIVALEILPPRGKEPRRVTSGLGSVVVLRMPDPAPIYSEQVTLREGAWLRADDLAPWLEALLELADEPAEEAR